MRIGLIAPPVERVPPVRYGGSERVIALLADALVERGHDVTVFASADSLTRARLVATVDRPVWHGPPVDDVAAHWSAAVERAYAAAARLDVIHNHADHHAFAAARRSGTVTVTTVHGSLEREDVAAPLAAAPDQRLVAISRAQRALMPEARWVGTVHHGLPRDLYRPSYARGSYLAFCGRISAEKGLHRAIDVALRAGLPLRVAARPPLADWQNADAPADREYLEKRIRPLLAHPLVDYVGELTDAEKQDLFAGALAVLFPIEWSEPFGLVLIEALACGAPVLARPLGAVPEVITHGVTGFHCDTTDDFLAAIGRVGDIDRRACRREFEDRFLVGHMAAGYEAVYRSVTTGDA